MRAFKAMNMEKKTGGDREAQRVGLQSGITASSATSNKTSNIKLIDLQMGKSNRVVLHEDKRREQTREKKSLSGKTWQVAETSIRCYDGLTFNLSPQQVGNQQVLRHKEMIQKLFTSEHNGKSKSKWVFMLSSQTFVLKSVCRTILFLF